MVMDKECIECKSIHHTEQERCPACDGVREWHIDRYKQMRLFDGRIFDLVYDNKIRKII